MGPGLVVPSSRAIDGVHIGIIVGMTLWPHSAHESRWSHLTGCSPRVPVLLRGHGPSTAKLAVARIDVPGVTHAMLCVRHALCVCVCAGTRGTAHANRGELRDRWPPYFRDFITPIRWCVGHLICWLPSCCTHPCVRNLDLYQSPRKHARTSQILSEMPRPKKARFT